MSSLFSIWTWIHGNVLEKHYMYLDRHVLTYLIHRYNCNMLHHNKIVISKWGYFHANSNAGVLSSYHPPFKYNYPIIFVRRGIQTFLLAQIFVSSRYSLTFFTHYIMMYHINILAHQWQFDLHTHHKVMSRWSLFSLHFSMITHLIMPFKFTCGCITTRFWRRVNHQWPWSTFQGYKQQSRFFFSGW